MSCQVGGGRKTQTYCTSDSTNKGPLEMCEVSNNNLLNIAIKLAVPHILSNSDSPFSITLPGKKENVAKRAFSPRVGGVPHAYRAHRSKPYLTCVFRRITNNKERVAVCY